MILLHTVPGDQVARWYRLGWNAWPTQPVGGTDVVICYVAPTPEGGAEALRRLCQEVRAELPELWTRRAGA